MPAATAEAITVVNRGFRLLGMRSWMIQGNPLLDEVVSAFEAS
jgi:hypothetical protein